MSKLYLFGIGGTGSRVIRSLTNLLMSGVKLNDEAGNAMELVPIIIDPDQLNGDLLRTKELLTNYKTIRAEAFANDGLAHFFSTEIKTLGEYADPGAATMGFQMLDDKSYSCEFKKFIGYNEGLENQPENKALIDALFSSSELDSDMTVGFKGHPSMGSIVLNQFVESREFRLFAQNFEQGDKIFIISSIFGGTGAAGFPLLVKNIRQADAQTPNHERIKNAQIGGVSVLPYFSLLDPSEGTTSEINSNLFMMKSKAALAYYENGGIDVDRMYYIGDTPKGNYENSEGGDTQINKAHFVELASALAIIDFASSVKGEREVRAFGIPEYTEGNRITAIDLGTTIRGKFYWELCAFYIFEQFLSKKMYQDNHSYYKDCELSKILSSTLYTEHLEKTLAQFSSWLTELSENNVGFTPFCETEKYISKCLNGINAQKELTWNDIFSRLNKDSKNVSGRSPMGKFISHFGKVLSECSNDMKGKN